MRWESSFRYQRRLGAAPRGQLTGSVWTARRPPTSPRPITSSLRSRLPRDLAGASSYSARVSKSRTGHPERRRKIGLRPRMDRTGSMPDQWPPFTPAPRPRWRAMASLLTGREGTPAADALHLLIPKASPGDGPSAPHRAACLEFGAARPSTPCGGRSSRTREPPKSALSEHPELRRREHATFQLVRHDSSDGYGAWERCWVHVPARCRCCWCMMPIPLRAPRGEHLRPSA